MAQKNNIRSIRFSDELAGLIESQPGDTFTQKFENLIVKCYWELPKKEEELRRVQELIDQKRKQLADLQHTTQQIHRLKMYIIEAEDNLKLVMKQAQTIAETAEKAEV